MDANQRWDVDEAISYMKQLAKFKPVWIEEPTSPDDVLGNVQPDNKLNWFFLMILNFYRAKIKVEIEHHLVSQRSLHLFCFFILAISNRSKKIEDQKFNLKKLKCNFD